jgi:hypothetical protein
MGLYSSEEIRQQIGRRICQKLYPILGVCEHPLCLDMATDRHHIDENTFNNERSNIAFLCRRHHALAHRPIANFIISRPSYRYDLSGMPSLFHQGLTIAQMAIHFGCSTQPIKAAIKRLRLIRPLRRASLFGAANPAWKGGREYKPVLIKKIAYPEGPNFCQRGPCALCNIPFLGRGRQKVCNSCMTTESYPAWQHAQHSLARRRFEDRRGPIQLQA